MADKKLMWFAVILRVDGLYAKSRQIKGYPKGLKGDQIPLVSRIISIVDAYDAMTSERSYRDALPEAVAIAELQKHSGTQFDPNLVRVFINEVLEDRSVNYH